MNLIDRLRVPVDVYGHKSDPARQKWPVLHALMSTRLLPDGTMKTLARISVRYVPNGVEASLNDTSLGKAWAVTVERLEAVYEALEAALNDPEQRYQKELGYGEGFEEVKKKAKKALDDKKQKR